MPLVLRTPHGGGLSAGPQHSQCLEAWFAHVPGLKVLAPYSAADAKGRKVNVSIKALEINDEREAVAQYGSSDSGASLGDIFQAAMKKKEDKK